MLEKNEVSPTDHKKMIKFTKTSDRLFSGPGLPIKKRVCNEVNCYKELERIIDVKKKSATKEMDLYLALTFF